MEERRITMIYQWKQNRFPVEAQKAGIELERIKDKHGGIIPKTIVDESKDKKAVLHGCFEWNDTKAAEGYREVQAREIIRNIVVVKTAEETQEKEVTVRAFVPVAIEEEKPKKYITFDEAMNDEDYRSQIINQALQELIAFKNKYSQLKELAELFDTIDKFTEKKKVS